MSERLAERYARVRSKLAPYPRATLIAVSKTHPLSAIEALYALGQRDFGENYVQELMAKADALRARCPELRWHFVGHLQTNKVKALVSWVHCVHSVDSEKLARELSKRWVESGRAVSGPLPVFVEVNVDAAATKTGVEPADAPALASAAAALPGLAVEGLMCVPEPGGGAEPFRKLRALEARCRPATRGALSMGMSGDYEQALAEGATHVRVGTAIFGDRA